MAGAGIDFEFKLEASRQAGRAGIIAQARAAGGERAAQGGLDRGNEAGGQFGAGRQNRAGQSRVNSGGEKAFAGINIADSGDRVLREQKGFNHLPAVVPMPPQQRRRQMARQRLHPQSRETGMGKRIARQRHKAEPARIVISEQDRVWRRGGAYAKKDMVVLDRRTGLRAQSKPPAHAQMHDEMVAAVAIKGGDEIFAAPRQSADGASGQTRGKIGGQTGAQLTLADGSGQNSLAGEHWGKGAANGFNFGQFRHGAKFNPR